MKFCCDQNIPQAFFGNIPLTLRPLPIGLYVKYGLAIEKIARAKDNFCYLLCFNHHINVRKLYP